MTNKEKYIVFIINFVLTFIVLSIPFWVINSLERHGDIMSRLVISYLLASYVPIYVPKEKNEGKDEK